jgi:DNA gyrase/topoisomerase IV subunit A
MAEARAMQPASSALSTVQAVPGALLHAQRRLGQALAWNLHAGTKGATLKNDDSMEEVLHVMDHDSVLFFTQVPLLTRAASCLALLQHRLLETNDLTDNQHCSCPVALPQDGVARSLPAHQIPQGSRTAQGSAITQVRATC